MMNKFLCTFLLFLLFLPFGVLAVEFNSTVSSQDQQAFDQILAPVMKIYDFIKYAATVLAVVFMVFAGLNFVVSGGDQSKRESAKTMATYIVVGLVVIWVAPLIVQFITG